MEQGKQTDDITPKGMFKRNSEEILEGLSAKEALYSRKVKKQ